MDESRPPRSILFVVTDDAPFLVDTTRMVVERHHLDIHLMVHPMLDVARDACGAVTQFGHRAGPTEAWTQVEIDYCDSAAAASLEADALAAVADVHLIVDDFPEMRDRMVALGGNDPILEWLAASTSCSSAPRCTTARTTGSSSATAPSSDSSAPITRSIRPPPMRTHRVVRSSSRVARPCRRSTAGRGGRA